MKWLYSRHCMLSMIIEKITAKTIKIGAITFHGANMHVVHIEIVKEKKPQKTTSDNNRIIGTKCQSHSCNCNARSCGI